VEILVTWYCANCDCENEDDYTNTACPMCENCEAEYDWTALLTNEQFEKFNIALASEQEQAYSD
jgi:hypothetical protein